MEPINEKIHLYDTGKLEEIIQNEDMYNTDLVKKCKEELEIRKLNTQLESKVSEFDDMRIQEILDSPSIYSQELVRSCEIEKTRRREEILKKEKQEEEERRLMYEQREMERKEDMLSWLRKSGLIILGVIIVLIGILFFLDSYVTESKMLTEQEEMEIEQKRLLEGPFVLGESHLPSGGFIVYLDKTEKHGLVMTYESKNGRDMAWAKELGNGWRLPTKREIELIWSNIDQINQYHERDVFQKYTRGSTKNRLFSDDGNSYAFDGTSSSHAGETRLVKDF